MKRVTFLLAASLVLIACTPREKSGSATDTSAPVAADVPADVQTAVAVKQAVDANPGKADSILKAHGLTPAGFDSLMYKISADADLRAAYASASR